MSEKGRIRVDYMPGNAALEALGLAADMFPNIRQQALIDKLVITGICALRWKPPALYGADRDCWQLTANLRPDRSMNLQRDHRYRSKNWSAEYGEIVNGYGTFCAGPAIYGHLIVDTP